MEARENADFARGLQPSKTNRLPQGARGPGCSWR